MRDSKAKGSRENKLLKACEEFVSARINLLLSMLIAAILVFWLMQASQISLPKEVQLTYAVLAENLLKYHAITFNGNPSLNLPVMPLAIAAFIQLGFPTLAAFKFVSVLSAFVTAILLYYLTRSLTGDRTVALLSVVLLMSNPPFILYSVDYFRESLFTLLVLAWYLLLVRGSIIPASVMAGLCALTRDHGLLMVPIGVVMLFVWGKKWGSAKYLVLSSVMPLVWFLRNWAILAGRPFNMSFMELLTHPHVVYMPVYSYAGLSSDYMPQPHILLFFILAYMTAVTAPFIAASLLSSYDKIKKPLMFVLLYALAHITLLGGMANIVRYMMPIIPFLSLFAALGVAWAAGLQKKFKGLLLLSIAIVLVIPQINTARMDVRGEKYVESSFKDMASWLDGNLPKDSRIIVLGEKLDVIPYNRLNHYSSREYFLYPPAMPSYSKNMRIFTYEMSNEYEPASSLEEYEAENKITHALVMNGALAAKFPGWKEVHRFKMRSTNFNDPDDIILLQKQ